MKKLILLAGIIVDVCAAVGFIYFLIKEKYLIGFILLCVTVVLLVAIIYRILNLNGKFPMEIKEAEFILTIIEPKGTLATLTKKQILIPKVKSYEFHWDRNLRVTGTIANFITSLGAINEIRNEAGGYSVLTKFHQPLRREIEYKRVFTCECKESFTQDEEDTAYTVDYPTRKAIIKVEFPKERICKKIIKWVVIIGAQEFPTETMPTLDDVRETITWNIPKPKLGQTYYLKWEW